MAKETNHRRKCKVDKVAEELDLDKLARELKKNNKSKKPQNKENHQKQNKNKKPYPKKDKENK